MRIGFLIIGNEILSGRTAEKNLPALAALLAKKGLRVNEARVVRDAPPLIAAALRELRTGHDYVFASGGIGPTHDDVTVEGVALAFAVAVVENQEALAILQSFYKSRGQPLTATRRRMARMPAGAAILKSDFPGAPGYVMDNVAVCAGVPKIFCLMAATVVASFPDFPLLQTTVLRVQGPESELAVALAKVQERYPLLEIGSYPREEDGTLICHLVFGGVDEGAVAAAVAEMVDFLGRQGILIRNIV